MKKIYFLILALLVSVAMPQVAQAYDFSKTVSSGQTLYFNIISDNQVEVTYENYENSDLTWGNMNNNYTNANRPTGSLTIPQTITWGGTTYTVVRIRSAAFFQCVGLTSVSIPNTVTHIGSYAFTYCSGLTSVSIPNTVTHIKDYAFAYCSGLTGTLQLPKNLQYLGYRAFRGCSGLTKLNYYPINCTTIGNEVFDECNNLHTLTIGSTVNHIPEDAFNSCSNLTTVRLYTTNCTMGSADNPLFDGFSNLNTLYYSTSTLCIPDYAFKNCTSLTNVRPYYGLDDDLIYHLETIGASAFEGCDGLTTVTLPNTVTTIGNSAFKYCEGLTSFSFPTSLTTIGDSAFLDCIGLTSLSLPSSLTTIGNHAFYFCTGLTGTLSFPNSLTSIGDYAFGYCYSLASLNFNISFSSLTSIGTCAFMNCSGLTGSLSLPDSLTTIGNWAFTNCSGLTSVTDGPSLTTVGVCAFKDCSGIAYADFESDNLSSIGNHAFENCTQMEEITVFCSTPPSLGTEAFLNTPANLRIAIPCGTRNAYRSAWGNSYNFYTPQSRATYVRETYAVCDSFTWHGVTYTDSPGSLVTYGPTWNGVESCYIYYVLDLTINRSLRSHDYVESCQPYTWEVTGKTYNKSGDKYYKSTTPEGCPIRDTLTLTIVKGHSYVYEVNSCLPYYWVITGKTYNKSGVKTFKSSQPDAEGCYTYDTLRLNIIKGYSYVSEVTSCQPYTWVVNGKTYNKSGIKTYKTPAGADGCAIYDTLKLNIVKGYGNTVEVTSCVPYTWDVTGRTYNKSGVKTYKSSQPDADGCYTYDTLRLTVVDKIANHEYVTNCGPYTWDVNGRTYNQSGTKTYRSTADDGCPKYDTLTLTVVDRWTNHEYVTNCGPYTWDVNGRTYNQSGTKTYRNTAADGCPKYDTLTLTVVNCDNSPATTMQNSQFTIHNLTIYPNPTTGMVHIDATEVDRVEVLDLVGRRVALFENSTTLNISNLAEGTYTLRITLPDGVAVRKVVKK